MVSTAVVGDRGCSAVVGPPARLLSAPSPRSGSARMTLPPDQPPPGGYPYYPPLPPPSRIAIGMVFVGAPVYVVVNIPVGFAAFIVAGSTTSQNGDWVFGIAALVLAFVAFG